MGARVKLCPLPCRLEDIIVGELIANTSRSFFSVMCLELETSLKDASEALLRACRSDGEDYTAGKKLFQCFSGPRSRTPNNKKLRKRRMTASVEDQWVAVTQVKKTSQQLESSNSK